MQALVLSKPLQHSEQKKEILWWISLHKNTTAAAAKCTSSCALRSTSLSGTHDLPCRLKPGKHWSLPLRHCPFSGHGMQSPGKEQKGDLYSCMVKEETNPKKAKKKNLSSYSSSSSSLHKRQFSKERRRTIIPETITCGLSLSSQNGLLASCNHWIVTEVL